MQCSDEHCTSKKPVPRNNEPGMNVVGIIYAVHLDYCLYRGLFGLGGFVEIFLRSQPSSPHSKTFLTTQRGYLIAVTSIQGTIGVLKVVLETAAYTLQQTSLELWHWTEWEECLRIKHSIYELPLLYARFI